MLLYGTGTSAIAVHGLKYCYQLQVRFCFSATTCLFFSFFVNQISREPLNAFVPSSQGRRVWSLAWTSLNVKFRGHQGQKICCPLPSPPSLATTEWRNITSALFFWFLCKYSLIFMTNQSSKFWKVSKHHCSFLSVSVHEVIFNHMQTNAAFHWSREVVITSSRAVKKRSIHLVKSWTRNHDQWTRVGFVHLEFTVGVAPWHDVMQFKVDWI